MNDALTLAAVFYSSTTPDEQRVLKAFIELETERRNRDVANKLESLAKEFDYAAWKGFGQNGSEFEKGYKLAMEIAARRLREK